MKRNNFLFFKLFNFYIAVAAVMLLTACDDLLEPAKENLKSIEETQAESASVKGFLVNAYRVLPGYYDDTDYATDDAVTNQKSNSYLKMATGSWTAENNPISRWTSSYAAIQYIHLFLNTMEGQQYVKNETVNALLTQRLTGEAHALRAIHMYYLLRAHAGLTADGQLLGVQMFDGFVDVNSDFNQPRSLFADCVAAALQDLDEAAKLLPMTYGDVTTVDEIPAKLRSICSDPELYNRAMGNVARQLVDGLIVESFRSRLLLMAASPAFATSGWAEAADAAANVIDFVGGVAGLAANGLTYYTNAADIAAIKDGSNPAEIIWRAEKQANNSDQEKNNYPPSLFGNGYTNPTQNLVDAFPMANGYPVSDARSNYNAQDPFAGRDPRLALYIIYDGSTAGPLGSVIRTGSKSGTDDGIDAIESRSTRTGYYMKKRLNMAVNCDPTSSSGQDHYIPRIRYTEIFLNYAEAANEAWGPKATGSHGYSAYDVIKAIRLRAGIDADDPYLEECAADKDKMRALIQNERRLELCFEGFRFWDLRRWKGNLNETARGIDINEDVTGITISPLNVENRSFQSYMLYGPIPYSETLKYNQLQQNAGW